MQGLECDRVHGGDGGELHQTFDVSVMKLRGDARECVEPRHEQLRGAVGTGELSHAWHLRGGIGRSCQVPRGPDRCQARDLGGDVTLKGR